MTDLTDKFPNINPAHGSLPRPARQLSRPTNRILSNGGWASWSFVSLASLAWLGCSRWFWDDQLQLTKPSNPIILWALLFPFATYNFHQRLVFWNSIHQEVASDSFCFLINYSWLLVFILYVFSLPSSSKSFFLEL